jgi:hypothetical protein
MIRNVICAVIIFTFWRVINTSVRFTMVASTSKICDIIPHLGLKVKYLNRITKLSNSMLVLKVRIWRCSI